MSLARRQGEAENLKYFNFLEEKSTKKKAKLIFSIGIPIRFPICKKLLHTLWQQSEIQLLPTQSCLLRPHASQSVCCHKTFFKFNSIKFAYNELHYVFVLIWLRRASFINCCQVYAVSVIRFIAFIFGKQVKKE